MNYIKIMINTTPEALEDTAANLSLLGYDCLQIEDERDITAQLPRWEMTDEGLLEYYRGLCRAVLYLPDRPGAAEEAAALAGIFPGTETELCREEDWADNWKQYYKPFTVGEKLAVHPHWLPMEDYGTRKVYLSNPGMSFGTGLHASTRLCLESLERRGLDGKRVLDIGCGSGILGLCALLMGAASLTGVDIDPLAADISRETASLNSLSERSVFYAGDFLTDAALRQTVGGGFDVICTNIVADVILALLPLIPSLLTPGGVWLTAGIIEARSDEVVRAAEGVFRLSETAARDGWCAFCAENP